MNKVIPLSGLVGRGYKEFWNTQKRYRIVIGGRASKKSTTTALWFIYNMMKYPQANLLVIRKVNKDNRDSTFAQLKWAIRRLQVTEDWKTIQNPLEITYLPTGQKILFRGLDEPDSVTSITVENGVLCWVWFEEFYQIAEEEKFNKVDLSVRGEVPAPLFKQITGTLNPWNEKHWIKTRFFDNPDEETFTAKTNYLVNEFLDDKDRKVFELMKEKNPRRYNIEGLGNWGVSEGLIYDNWHEIEFDYTDYATKRDFYSCIGLDFGYTADPTALVCMLINTEAKRLLIYDEHFEKGMSNQRIADLIKYKGLAKEEITADSAEPKSIDQIKSLGISRIKPAKKGADSVNNGIQFLKDYDIMVHPKCTNIINEFNNYAWNTKDGKQTNSPIDDFNHGMDAMRYGIEKYITGKKQIKATINIF